MSRARRAVPCALAAAALATSTFAQTDPPGAPAAPPIHAPGADDPAPPARSGPVPRFSAVMVGGLALANSSFAGERRFTEFAEEGRLDADYSRGLGPEFELGLEYALGRRFGLGLRFNLLSRAASSDYEADLPHPLFLAQPRQVTGALDSLSYNEQAVHLDLAYRLTRGRWRYGVFAGPTYASVTAELLDRVQYQQSYPFDEVQVTTLSRGRYTGSGFGFNAGVEADCRLGGRAAAALLVRYHHLSPDFPDSAGSVEIDAGGLQVGAGVRFFFR